MEIISRVESPLTKKEQEHLRCIAKASPFCYLVVERCYMSFPDFQIVMLACKYACLFNVEPLCILDFIKAVLKTRDESLTALASGSDL